MHMFDQNPLLYGAMLLMLAVGGCGTSQQAASPGEVSADLGRAMRDGRAGSSRLMMKDNGLEMRRWIIADETERIASAMARNAEPAPMSSAAQQMLRRNGIRIRRVPARELPELLRGLGGSTIDQQWWLGQSPDWREIHARSLGGQLRGIAVDNSVRTFNGGSFSLLMRTWTLKTTEGPRMQFEMVPGYTPGDGGELRRMLALEEPEGEVFPSMLVQFVLEHGYAYVLTCETPTVDWDDTASSVQSRGAIDVPEGGAVRGEVGPPMGAGPDPGGPWTIGDALLRGESRVGSRGVIVLVPHLPERLYPVEMLVDDEPGQPETVADDDTDRSLAPAEPLSPVESNNE